MTQLKASISKKNSYLDGLSQEDIEKHIADNPHQPLVVVAVFDVEEIRDIIKLGKRVPKLSMRSNEVMVGADADTAMELHRRTHARRTGKPAPPAGLWDGQAGDVDGDPAAGLDAESEGGPAEAEAPKSRTRRAKAQE